MADTPDGKAREPLWAGLRARDQEELVRKLGGPRGGSALLVWFRLNLEAFKADSPCVQNVSEQSLKFDTGLSRGTVIGSIQELERLGFIKVERRKKRGTKENEINSYTLLRGRYAQPDYDKTEPGGSSDSDDRTGRQRCTDSQEPPKKEGQETRGVLQELGGHGPAASATASPVACESPDDMPLGPRYAEPSWTERQYVDAFQSISDGCAKVDGQTIVKALRKEPNPARRAAAFNSFDLSYSCRVNPTDRPAAMLFGYMKQAYLYEPSRKATPEWAPEAGDSNADSPMHHEDTFPE